jgi:hypothetical protein
MPETPARERLLADVRQALDDGHAQYVAELRERWRVSGFGTTPPEEHVLRERISGYQVTVNAETYFHERALAAVAHVLARYLDDPDIIKSLEGGG